MFISIFASNEECLVNGMIACQYCYIIKIDIFH
jgi:hypothetical protein